MLCITPFTGNDHEYGVQQQQQQQQLMYSACHTVLLLRPPSGSLPSPSPAISCLLSELPAASVKGLGSRSSF